MLSLLFFLIDATTFGGTFSGNLYYQVPTLNFMGLGYSNPALASGLVGAVCNPAGLFDITGKEVVVADSNPAITNGLIDSVCNPAGLFDITGKEVVVAGGIGMSTKLEWEPKISIGEDEEQDTIIIPLDMSFSTPSGINLVGIGMKFQKIAVGIGFMDGFGIGGKIEGDGKITQTLSDSIRDTLTNENISEIPVGTNIPVIWTFDTPVNVNIKADGKSNCSERSLFLCAASNMGPVKVGLGIIYNPIRGKVEWDAGSNANTPCSLRCTPEAGSDWTTDITGYTVLNQKLGNSSGTISLAGNEFSCLTGLQVKFWIISIGTSVAFTPTTIFKIDGNSSVMYVTDAPSIDAIHCDTATIIIDTANQRASGKIDIDISPMPETTEIGNIQEIFKVPGRISATIGSAIKIGPVTLGSAIGGCYSPVEKSAWTNFGLESRVFIPLRANLGVKVKGYQIKGDSGNSYIPIPSAVLDIGSSFNIKQATVYLGFRTNPIGLAMSVVSAFNKELKEDAKEQGFNELPGFFSTLSPVIGVKLNY